MCKAHKVDLLYFIPCPPSEEGGTCPAFLPLLSVLCTEGTGGASHGGIMYNIRMYKKVFSIKRGAIGCFARKRSGCFARPYFRTKYEVGGKHFLRKALSLVSRDCLKEYLFMISI